MMLLSKPLRFLPVGVLLCGLGLLPLFSQAPASTEWKLKVIAASAPIHSIPDLAGPTETTAARGTNLTAYEKIGDWYRVIFVSTAEGFTLIGYVSASDVELIQEKKEKPADFWSGDESSPGLGLTLRVHGGAASFSLADLDAAVIGMEAQEAASLSARGFSITDQKTPQLRTGTILGGEIAYFLSSRFSLGLGVGYSRATRNGQYWLVRDDAPSGPAPAYTMVGFQIVELFSAQVLVSYSLPISRVLALSVGAGPTVFFSKYYSSLSFDSASFQDALTQNVHGAALGATARLGLEAAINKRAAAFIEVRGRLASVSEHKGDERLENTTDMGTWNQKTVVQDTRDGILYMITEGGWSRFVVRTAAPTETGVIRKAAFNLSGFDLVGGIRLRF